MEVDRICRRCNTKLSVYNEDDFCNSCLEVRRDYFLQWSLKRKTAVHNDEPTIKVYCSNEECGKTRNVHLTPGESLKQYLERRPQCLSCTMEKGIVIEWKRKG